MFTNRLFRLFIALMIGTSLVACAAPAALPTATSFPTSLPLSTNTVIPDTQSATDPTSVPTLDAGPLEFKGHTDDVWDVDISPDGKYLITASDDKTARLWDLATGQTIQVFSNCNSAVGDARFSPDGTYVLLGCADHAPRLVDITTGQTVQTFSGHTGGVDWADFSPDGKQIITAGGDDKTARIWDLASGQTLYILKSNSDYLPRVAFSPDGKYAFTDRLWDAATGEAIQTFVEQSNAVSCVAFSPDSKYVATGSDDGIARIWDVSTGQMVREFTGHQGFVNGIKFSPDGKFLLTGSADQTARLWDVATGQTIHIFDDHRGGVQGVTFSPDGKLVAAASDDGTAMVWKLEASSAVIPAQSGITLHLAVADKGGRPSEPYVLAFIDQVKTLSNGTMTIEPTWSAANSDDANFERGVIQLVKEGKYDLGIAGSRAFDLENINSFQALQTPFLIDNNALAEAVATSDIAAQMLDQLSSAGLTGLTLWPEDLRHPFSYNADKPLLSPEDFAGLNIRTQASKLSYQLIKGMGGIPLLGDNEEGAESGLRQGASLPGSPVATGNVTFFAKYQVLFGNRDAWEKLSEEQRAILMQAAMAVQKKAIAEHPSEVDAAKAWCASEGTIVITSDEQVAEFKAAAQPVFEKLEQDSFNAGIITELADLKTKTVPSSGAEACVP